MGIIARRRLGNLEAEGVGSPAPDLSPVRSGFLSQGACLLDESPDGRIGLYRFDEDDRADGEDHVVGAIQLILAPDQHIARLLGLGLQLVAYAEGVAQDRMIRPEVVDP